MPKSAELIFQETDNSQQVSSVPQNISGILYDAERGPINDPKDVIVSSLQFDRIFGGIKADGSNKAQYYAAIRAINRGSALRVCNIKHYTSIIDKSTLTAEFAEVIPTTITTLSAALVAGGILRVTLGPGGGSQLVKDFPYSTSSTATIDALLDWLLNDYTVSWYLNGGVVYAKRTSNTSFVIIPQTPGATIAISTAGTSAPTVTTSTIDSVVNGNNEPLFALLPKYPGLKYNDLVVEVTKVASYSNSFDVKAYLLNSNASVESYTGISIPNNSDTNYLSAIADGSDLITPFYFDRHASNYSPIPKTSMVFRYSGGTDGSSLTAGDLIGSSITNLGLNAFDGYDDISRIASLIDLGTSNMVYVHQAANTYANSRADLVYFLVLTEPNANVTNLLTQRNNLGIGGTYSRIYTAGSGIEILDTLANTPNNSSIFISPIGDLLGIAASSADKFGPWYSYANSNRGTLFNLKSVGNTWGTNNGKLSLDLLARNQINSIIAQDKIKMVWGNFTSQVGKESLLSYNSIRDLLIFIKKSLRPTLRPFLEEPNDVETWIKIYNVIYPFFSGLESKRALYPKESGGWSWKGDQNAASLKDLIINNVADVQAGKYKVQLDLRPINSLQTLTLGLNLDSADLSISIAELN